jgi:pyruvate/2-oxoglutarate/acetoin dehydrogenase E1 component
MSDEPVIEILMPRLSDAMEDATISRWLKQPGDSVARGDELVEVETDKTTVVYEAEAAGTLVELLVTEGSEVPLGTPIARLAGVGSTRATGTGAPAPSANPGSGSAPAAPPADAVVVEFREAIRQALDEELGRDDRVIFFGEDVAVAGGIFAATPGLFETYGPLRVFDTPISELAMAGAAYGAAVCGLRPVIEIMFADFLPLTMDSLLNQASKYHFLDGSRGAPLVVRSSAGGGARFGAIHSQMPIGWFNAITGLKIVAPATPGDAKGLLKAAIRDENPVLFLEHKRLYSVKGPLGDEVVPLGVAAVVRPGSDLTIVTAMKSVHDALAAASTLEQEHGISVEVVDLRTIRPLDTATILRSVEKTSRVLVVEEGPRSGGFSADVLARVAEEALGDLDDAWRLTTPDSQIPYSPSLEDAFLPSEAAIVETVVTRLR